MPNQNLQRFLRALTNYRRNLLTRDKNMHSRMFQNYNCMFSIVQMDSYQFRYCN